MRKKKDFLELLWQQGSGVIDGQKKDDIGGYGEIFIFNKFFGLESYGINLWKEFGDDVEEPLDALIKLLDEWEYENDTWIDDDGRLERWLVEFQKHAPTKEKREKLRK